MNVLFIGDIVGRPGREAVGQLLDGIRDEESIALCIANAENAAGGSGLTPDVVNDLLSYGVDVLTAGDHVWRNKDVMDVIDTEKRLLRPANFPPGVPGSGTILVDADDTCVGIINLLGRTFMPPMECPFRLAKTEIGRLSKETKIIIVDFHAEATSEKIAMGWYLDGTVSAVLGTHTHVQTADEKILPRGTACITDVGMTGSMHSVLGRKIESVLETFLTGMPRHFPVATEHVQLSGVIVTVDNTTGKAASIKRIVRALED